MHFYKGKYYRIVFPIKGYNNINVIKISNDDVEKYLGPNNDFHGKKLKEFSYTLLKSLKLITFSKFICFDRYSLQLSSIK